MDWIDSNTNEVFRLRDYPEAIGFTYVIEYTNGMFYLGKKNLFKKVVLPRNSKRNKKEVIYRESTDWKQYTGSSKETKGLTIKKKVVLDIAITNRALTYLETKLLFHNDVLFNDKCLNKNIGGLYFDNVLEPLKYKIVKEYRD